MGIYIKNTQVHMHNNIVASYYTHVCSTRCAYNFLHIYYSTTALVVNERLALRLSNGKYYEGAAAYYSCGELWSVKIWQGFVDLSVHIFVNSFIENVYHKVGK